MRSKEAYLEFVLANRALLASPDDAARPCPKRKCEWHGDCYAGIRLHRLAGDHLPNCLQPMLREQVLALLRVVEMLPEPKPMTPNEYWDYVNAVAPPEGRRAAPAPLSTATDVGNRPVED